MRRSRRDERERLIEEIVDEARACGSLTGRPSISARVLDALRRVPRDRFVPAIEAGLAWLNAPLPIGQGQTISQPFIVAIMTELLDAKADDVVLEIGTGSGYQAAILSGLVRHVYTVEVVPALAERAERVLAELGFANVTVRLGDGALGWPEHAPFDRIIVTAVARAAPPALIEQLKPGGRMVIPLGEPGGDQMLSTIDRSADGRIELRQLLPVAFVPLTGG